MWVGRLLLWTLCPSLLVEGRVSFPSSLLISLFHFYHLGFQLNILVIHSEFGHGLGVQTQAKKEKVLDGARPVPGAHQDVILAGWRRQS